MRPVRCIAWLALGLLAAGCTRPERGVEPEGILVWRQVGEPSSLDPALAGVERAQVVIRRTHEGLVAPDPATGRPIACLAERWEITPDGRRYTFHLRGGVRFHDGSELQAADVVYSLSRHLDPAIPSSLRPYLGDVEGGVERLEGRARDVAGLAALDPSTVEVRLARPFAPLLGVLSMPQAAILPAGAVLDPERGFPGTGPFAFDRWERGRYLALGAFPDHWRGAATTAGVTFRFVEDNGTALAMFEAGEIDLLNGVPAGRREEVARRHPGHRTAVGVGVYALGINHDRSPLGENVLLRRALAHAVDRDYISKTVGRGKDRPASQLLPPGMMGRDPDLGGLRFDLERARALLADAGFPEGRGLPTLRAVYAVADGTSRQLLERLAADLATLGVELVAEPVDNAAFFDMVGRGGEAMSDYDLFRAAWIVDYADPDAMFTPMLHSDSIGLQQANVSYRDAEMDSLIEQGRSAVDEAAREELYRAAARRAEESVALIPVYWIGDEIVSAAGVEGIVLGPLGETVIPVERVRVPAR